MIKKMMLLGVLILIAGCAFTKGRQAEIYPFSYDRTFNMATEALDNMDPWTLHRTDMTRGIIVVGYNTYVGPEREKTFIIKRLGPYRTKIELRSENADMFTEKFFNALDQYKAENIVTYPT